MDKIEVTCVNARNKPNEIPFTHWVKEQQPYNIIKVVRCMGGIAGVEIEEIDLKPYYPYKYFQLERFGLTQAQLEAYLEKVSVPEEELVEV